FMTFYGTSATGAAWIVPKRYVEKVGDDGFTRAPVGAGPYRVVSFTPGVDLVMEAVDGYWRKTPSVKRLVFRSMPDDTTRSAAPSYPTGFDAACRPPFPPFFSLGEAIGNDLQAVGIRTRLRTMERAAFLTAWRDKKLKGVIMGLGAPAGNAATRIEVYVTKNGIYASGVVPEIEDLFQRQARELDRKKRQALLAQIQQIMHDRVLHVPIYELAFLWGIGPRVEEAAVDHIKGFSYSAPYEDLRRKTR